MEPNEILNLFRRWIRAEITLSIAKERHFKDGNEEQVIANRLFKKIKKVFIDDD